LAQGGALALVTGAPPRIAFATEAALATFGASDLAGLEATAIAAQSPGARRLHKLSQSLALGAAPRMEQLRFFAGRSPIMLGWLCARVAGRDGDVFLVVADPRSVESGAPRGLAPHLMSPVGDAAAAPPLDGPVRFLWSLDAEDRFAAPDAALVARLGPNAPQAGEALEAFRARLVFDPGGAFAQVLATQRTFSALRLDWPEPGLGRARVSLISGAPQFDSARKFSGFKGFGVFTGEGVPARPEGSPIFARPPGKELIVTTDSEAARTDAIATSRQSTPAGDECAVEVATSSIDGGATSTPATGEKKITPLASSKTAREGGAEIFVFRPPPPNPTAGLNVVPIRPGATNMPPPSSALEAHISGEGGIVELSSQERDAFREIARALGARTRAPRADKSPGDSDDPITEPIADSRDAAVGVAGSASDSTLGGFSAPPNREVDAHCDAAALLDALPIGALVLRGGEAAYLNRTLLDLAGLANIEEFRVANALAQIFEGRSPAALPPDGERCGIWIRTTGGESIAVDASARPIFWRGEPATLVALQPSAEADHQSRLRAIESEGRLASRRALDLEAALDSTTDGVVRLDSAGRILAMSPRAESLFEYDHKERSGESFIGLLAPSSHSDATACFEGARDVGSGEAIEVFAQGAGGRSIPLGIAIQRLAAAPEPEFLMVLRDLSRVKALGREGQAEREKAERASALKSEFLARVSHEIRTPLHSILGFAEVIMEERFGAIGNDRYKNYVSDIHVSASHVMNLANDLLDLAKIEAGRMEFAFSPIDANRIIRECVTLMQPKAARERIIMRLSLFDKLPNVMADERSLRQIMLNLMSNAVKFNEPGGQVIVSTALDESGHPVIRVRDTGLGMNESELSVALEPFRQVSRGRRDDGSGLGLPLTKALVEANHADFSIKSRKEHGTLVEVAFPTVRAAQ
jgi:PAS domain S-box-containing protein